MVRNDYARVGVSSSKLKDLQRVERDRQRLRVRADGFVAACIHFTAENVS